MHLIGEPCFFEISDTSYKAHFFIKKNPLHRLLSEVKKLISIVLCNNKT